MSHDIPPELAETFQSLDQAIEEFRRLKEKLKGRPGQEGARERVAARTVRSEATA